MLINLKLLTFFSQIEVKMDSSEASGSQQNDSGNNNKLNVYIPIRTVYISRIQPDVSTRHIIFQFASILNERKQIFTDNLNDLAGN